MSRRIPVELEHLRDLDVRRPLDPLPSIKLKLGFLLAAAVASGFPFSTM